MAPIDQSLSRQKQGSQNATSKKPRPAPIDVDEFSEARMSNHSKAIQALVSQRESRPISKQHSFNSPTSLNYNMTNERCRNSIDGSTVKKGRKLVMLDEAGVSK